MVILEVFKKDIKIIYKSNLLSKATLVTFVFGIISIVLPFVFAYKSKGFWIKRDVFYEQPQVRFKGEYIFFATTNSDVNPLIICSSLPYYQEKHYILDTCTMIRVQEIDRNFDYLIEEFQLQLHVNLPKDSHLTSIYMIVPLDYKLFWCPLQMQAAVFFNVPLSLPVFEYTILSDVVATQRSPLICHHNSINNQYNYSMIGVNQTENYEILDMIQQYSNRNISVVMKNVYTTFTPGKKQLFSINLTLRYPEDRLYFKPGFWQVIKQAWIQYLAIYLIVSWCVIKIKNYIFNKRLVLYYEENPYKKKD